MSCLSPWRHWGLTFSASHCAQTAGGGHSRSFGQSGFEQAAASRERGGEAEVAHRAFAQRNAGSIGGSRLARRLPCANSLVLSEGYVVEAPGIELHWTPRIPHRARRRMSRRKRAESTQVHGTSS